MISGQLPENRLEVRLFGVLDLRSGEQPLPGLESARAESLLAYLLLHRDAPQARQRLAFLLWPDSSDQQARTNLRHLLHTLRRALPPLDRLLDVTPRTLQWRHDAPLWLDVAEFESAIARAGHSPKDDPDALRYAVDLYRGDLLEGCYDEWLLAERERLRTHHLEALAGLIRLLDSAGDPAGAIGYAERLLRDDPLREETYRLLMRLHDARGDRARALHVYHVCVTNLERELGIEPSPATREAYESLLPTADHGAGSDHAGPRLGGPPLVGRRAERERLVELWRAAERGRAQLVLVSGEPGIGKSRLVEEFRSWCVHHGALAAAARSYAAEGTIAYGPAVAWLRSDALRPRLSRLHRVHLTELARLLPELLTAVPDLAPPQSLAESDQRRRTFDAIARVIRAPGSPILLVADDLQWCDRETLQFLHYLLRGEADTCLLVVATARREEIDHRHPVNDLVAGLGAIGRCTEITLDRLGPVETATLAGLLAGQAVAGPDADRLYGETEGNPLFVVEALRAGWGTAREWMTPRVQAVIEARLAQLRPPARELVGLAATIGREFTTDILTDATEGDDAVTVQSLDELWRRRIIREQGIDAYDFSHDKIREVAFLGLSPVQRRHHHRRVAEALERRHSADPGPVSGQLAAHYEGAGMLDPAIAWYKRAAETARQLHANVEANRLLEHALDLLRTQPETPRRQERELALLTAVPASLGWVDGWASERLAAVHDRALQLADALSVDLAPPLLRSLSIASLSRRDFAGAREFGERLQARGARDADDMLLVESDYVLGIAAFWQGHFDVARGHFQSAVDHYRPDLRRAHLARYGLDPKVICQSRLGNTLWFLGRPESAIRASDEALALAETIGHAFSKEVALVFAALLSLELRDADRYRAHAARLVAGRPEDSSRPTQFSGQVIASYVDVLDGRARDAIVFIQETLERARGTDHAPGMRAALIRVLLEACAAAGDARTGLTAADGALQSGDGDRLWEAEIRRLRAGFLKSLGTPADVVETELERALAVARLQGARMLELRAATSLLRHHLESDNRAGTSQARARLEAIVAALPERPDNPDLRDAVAALGG